MAEGRRGAGQNYGDAGTLLYHSITQSDDANIGSLISTRFTGTTPQFNIVGSSAELYPPTKQPAPDAGSDLWSTRREQKRWLLKSHPGAFMGNFAFEEPLKDDMARYRDDDGSLNNRPLFALGSMPDRSDQFASNQVNLLATATGESGELIRLAVANDTRWQWGESRDAFLNLSVVDSQDKEEEAIWASDGLPVTQVKYAEGLSNQDFVRWIFVQKQTSTTILQPEYNPVPLSGKESSETAFKNSPSYVQPNPIFTIQHSETGGNAHSDVVFSPAAFGHKPMIAIIDECGYWSVWGIRGTRRPGVKTAHLSLRIQGHIGDGVVSNFTPQKLHPASRHGLLAIPNQTESKRQQTSSSRLGTPGPTLLMWKADKLEAIDMHTGANISPLEKLWKPDDRSSKIIDVQSCPAFQGRVFILSDRSISWMEVSVGEPLKTILTCPHGGLLTDNVKMTLCRLSDATAMAFVLSTLSGQMSVYWFENSGPAGTPQWQRFVTSIPASGDFKPDSLVHQISATTARLQLNGETAPSGLGSFYYGEGIEFYQVNVLGENLSMRYGIFTTNCNRNLEMKLPTKRLGWSTTEQKRRWKKKRKNFLRYFSSAFVLPDGVTDTELSMMLARNQGTDEDILPSEETNVTPRPARLNLEKFCQTIVRKMSDALRKGELGLPKDLFGAIQDMFSESNRLPLLTWYELFEQVGEQAVLEPITDGMEREVESLMDQADGSKVITQVRRSAPHEAPGSLISLAYVHKELSDLWLEPLQATLTPTALEQTQVWVAEVARDVFLSSYAVMIQDVPVLGPPGPEEASQSAAPSSSANPPSSPVSMRSTPPAASASRPDRAVERLRLLAGSMEPGELGTAKPLDLLSYWPRERGVDTQGYISSVYLATDDKFKEARERLQRKEARLKSHVEKFRRFSAKRQSMGLGDDAVAMSPRPPPMGLSPRPPPVQIMSSQQAPSSSQTQGPSVPPVTMSQPVSGLFGDRKKTKKPKRKSGFR